MRNEMEKVGWGAVHAKVAKLYETNAICQPKNQTTNHTNANCCHLGIDVELLSSNTMARSNSNSSGSGGKTTKSLTTISLNTSEFHTYYNITATGETAATLLGAKRNHAKFLQEDLTSSF